MVSSGSSQGDDSSSLLDCYLRVQLLFDDSFTRQMVCEIPKVEKRPKVSTKKVHLRLGSRSDVMKKQLVEILTDIQTFEGFPIEPMFRQLAASFYTANKSSILRWEADGILTHYAKYLESLFSKRTPEYYLHLVQFIDLMLFCKSTNHQKMQILQQRAEILRGSYLQLPVLSDPELCKAICHTFEIDDTTLQRKVIQLQAGVSKDAVIELVQSPQSIRKRYHREDFENIDKWKNWSAKVVEQDRKLQDKFADTERAKSPPSVLPPDLDNVVGKLTRLAFEGSPKFFETYIKCLQVWQVDPCQIFFHFIAICEDLDELSVVDPKKVVKAVSLAYLASPVEVTWSGWPTEQKKKAVEVGLRIYEAGKDRLSQSFLYFFENTDFFTECLLMLQELHLLSPQMVPRQTVADNLETSFKQRLNAHLQGLDPRELDLPSINKLLTGVMGDVNLLYEWKANNADLNKAFPVYKTAEMLLIYPAVDYVNMFISNAKKTGKSATFVSKGNRAHFCTLLEVLGNFNQRAKLDFDFQSMLFDEFEDIVNSWSAEMFDKTKQAIANDAALKRLDGCSYSASVQNVMGICNAYVKLLDSFQWTNRLQLAVLYADMYRGIAAVLRYYSNSMLWTLTRGLGQSRAAGRVNFQGDSCTCLNNVTKILQYFKEFENDKLRECSQVLEENQKEGISNPTKYVSVSIKDAENVEDNRGEPVSLSVIIDGLIQGRTRTIARDYNPVWDETFSGPVDPRAEQKGGYFYISLYDDRSPVAYKSLTYRFDMSQTSVMPIEEKISLQPKSGALNIAINVEAEKHNPMFYLSKGWEEIAGAKARAIKLLVDQFSMAVKDIFSRDHLAESLRLAPSRQPPNFKDQLVDAYMAEMQMHTIDELYDNLETELFDEVILRLWMKILDAAENLLLPRVSFIFHNIVSRLDKRGSLVSLSLGSRYHQTTKVEVTRVMGWCLQLRQMLSDPDKVLQEPLSGPMDKFSKIPQLFGLKEADLKDMYFQIWSEVSHQLPRKYARMENYDKTSLENSTESREMVMRVLLAKAETRFVKKVMEAEERFQRALKTEIEVEAMEW